ncbi:hypothetical protein nbrc107697_05310 [Gordonia crocea]|uniref:Lipoprotein n=2 Tax=Gordonia crocea TaxID=589162 RepID=A0A7M3SV18_9ACTN|nr:hypothetical protein nbrc107697_05310 [Gordonia crocea]
MRKFLSAIVATTALSGVLLVAEPASAYTPPTVTFSVNHNHRIVGKATTLPAGVKTCGFERSNPNPGPIIGSFGNDMVTVGNKVTAGDKVTLYSRRLPPGRYLARMSCFIKNRKSGMYEIVAVNEEWITVGAGRHH